MATLKFRDKDGAWKYAPSLKFKNGSNVFEITNGLKYKDEQGVWHKVNICGSKSDDGDYPTISTLATGTTVYLSENGSPAEYMIVHQGLPSDMYDASCDGVWLLRKDISLERHWHDSNVNDYGNSSLHKYLNNTLLNTFDPAVQSIIKQVKIPYWNGTGSGGSLATLESGLSTKVFLLSAYEVNLGISYIPVGSPLDYFKDNASRIAYMNGVATNWYLRTPATHTSTANLTIVGSSGNSITITDPTFVRGIRPAFILPYTVKLDPNTNTIIG